MDIELGTKYPRQLEFLSQGGDDRWRRPNCIYHPRHRFMVLQFLWQQLRISNIFFVVVACLEVAFKVRTHRQYSSVMPLVILFLLNSALAVWQYSKHRKWEKKMNRRNEDFKFIEFKNDEVKLRPGTKYLEDLRVGDIIYLNPKEKPVYIPADVILLGVDCSCHSGKNTCSKCFISTQHINGDSSSHAKQAPRNIIDMVIPEKIGRYKGTLTYEDPTPDLFQFEGHFGVESPQKKDVSLSTTHFIPRGSTLFNAKAVTCLVVYVGKETKMGQIMQNKDKIIHRTISDFAFDRCILKMIYIICILALMLTIIWYFTHDSTDIRSFERIILENECVGQFLEQLLFMFLELQFAIPISLLFIIEWVRIVMAWSSCGPMFSNPKNIDDLGKISHVVLDGRNIATLPEMEVKSISAEQYRLKCNFDELRNSLQMTDEKSKALKSIMESIIMIQQATKQSVKNVEDTALNSFIESLGDTMKSTGNMIQFNDSQCKIMEFISVPLQNGILFGVIAKILVDDSNVEWRYILKGNKLQLQEILEVPVLADFSQRGLLTHFYAAGKLDEDEIEKFQTCFANSRKMTVQEKDEEIFKMIPRNMKVIGSIGLRNKVNLESTKKIYDLQTAGLKIFVLSQQNLELTKGYCHDIGIKVQDIEIVESNEKFTSLQNETMDRHKSHILLKGSVLNNDILSTNINLLNEYKMIIISEMTSSLKRQVVKALNDKKKAERNWFLSNLFPFIYEANAEAVLVVGSSAHDVPMIKSADVSIYYNPRGLSCDEFEDANAYTNFSASSLDNLLHLILVDGIKNSFRVSKVTFFILYCSILRTFCEMFVWVIYGVRTSVYSSFDMASFMPVFIVIPALIIGKSDRGIQDDVILRNPILYMNNGDTVNSMKMLFLWILPATIHACIIANFTVQYFQSGAVWSNGLTGGTYMMGSIMYFSILLTAALKIAVIEPMVIPDGSIGEPRFATSLGILGVAAVIPLLYLLRILWMYITGGYYDLRVSQVSPRVNNILGSFMLSPSNFLVAIFSAMTCILIDYSYKVARWIRWEWKTE